MAELPAVERLDEVELDDLDELDDLVELAGASLRMWLLLLPEERLAAFSCASCSFFNRALIAAASLGLEVEADVLEVVVEPLRVVFPPRPP